MPINDTYLFEYSNGSMTPAFSNEMQAEQLDFYNEAQLPSEIMWQEMQTMPYRSELRAGPPSGGTSPGGNPTIDPLPIGDALWPLITITVTYVLFLCFKKKRKSSLLKSK